MPTAKKIVESLQSDFFNVMNTLTKKQLEETIQYLSKVYYNDGISLLSDENYDRLREHLLKKYGDSEVLTQIGAEVIKEKVTLPYFMGSMDKIKPDKNNLESWKISYPGKVCISDKLDGISALIIKSEGKRFLYTRGDGTVGQNITHMIPNIQIGDLPGFDTYAARGELIVSKANYEKVKEGKRGARQMVSGLANQKTLTAERKQLLALVEFVAYEVIVPENLKPTQQFELLDSRSTFHVARWSPDTDISIEKLSTILSERKASALYEIDGIIVAHDKVYPRTVGKNPDHAFAFKMAFAEQTAITEVLHVYWEASKNGYLKPTVNFEPVNIGGAVIQYASGFNASFIHNNGIGPGAFIDIIRSGDVIPYIREVKSIAPMGPQMPSDPWHWNETHVDAILDKISGNPDVQKRALLFFANTLDIGNCGEGTINKLHDSGIKTIPDFLTITESFLLEKVSGFGKASAAKLVANIRSSAEKATVAQWAVGSGIFGRGLGMRRLEPAFQLVPANLQPSDALVVSVAELPSWSRESAEGFVQSLPAFREFLEKVGVNIVVAPPAVETVVERPVKADGKFQNKVFLFTGFRSKDLEAFVEYEGGVLSDTFSKKVNVLVVKDSSVKNEKVKKALASGIAVITAEELTKQM